MKKLKKFLALFLALVMCLSLVNLSAFAVEGDTTDNTVQQGDGQQSNEGDEQSNEGDKQSGEGDKQSNEGDEQSGEGSTSEEEQLGTSEGGEQTEETTEDEESMPCEHEWDDGEAVEGGTKYTCTLCGESHVLEDGDSSFDANPMDDGEQQLLVPQINYNKSFPVTVSVTLNNEFNKGERVTVDTLKKNNFSLTVTLTQCNENGEVTTEEKNLTLDNATIMETSADSKMNGWQISWAEAIRVNEWIYYNLNGSTVTQDSFDPKYRPTIQVVSNGFGVEDYTCQTVVNSSFKRVDDATSEKSDVPFTWTGTKNVWIRTQYLGGSTTSAGITILHTYYVETPDVSKVSVNMSCQDQDEHASKNLSWKLKPGYEASGYFSMSKNEEGKWVLTVDSEKWLGTYNKSMQKQGVVDHMLVPGQEDPIITFTKNSETNEWMPDKKEVELEVKNDAVAKIVRDSGDVLFGTLQAAIDAAIDGETVEVLRDCTEASLQTAEKVTVNIPEGVTVSTNAGKTYALTVAGAGAELTITGAGTVQGSTYGVVAQKSGKLTVNMNGGTIKGSRGIYAVGAGTSVTVSAGQVEGLVAHAMYLGNGASATVEGNAKVFRSVDTDQGYAIGVYGPGGESTDTPTTLTVTGGTITNTKNAAISGNGATPEKDGRDYRNTKITITGGEITSTESLGIYHPQVGELTITGGTIKGTTGIEMRAGTLNVSDNANITGNGDYEANENNNGATTIGVGIALSQHVTERRITAVISGGTITGYHALVEHDLENKPESKNVDMSISGGVFNGTNTDRVSVKSDNLTAFITGGYFSDDLDAENAKTAKYVADGYAAHLMTTPAGYYNVHIPKENGVPDCTVCVAPTPSVTYYTLTINYVDEDGNAVATRYSRSHASGYKYSVTSPIVDGMNPDQDVVSGTLSKNTTITVTYGTNVPGTDIPDENPPLIDVGDKLNKTDHFSYVVGNEKGLVQPDRHITRAEAASIFFRLMTDEFRAEHWTTESPFPDVPNGTWYTTAVATAAKAGILVGTPEGNFEPDKVVTRAQFAALAANFISDSVTDPGTGDFDDTVDHWAAKQIRLAVLAKWITGVGGNKFDPDRPITLGEVTRLVNTALERYPDPDHMNTDPAQDETAMVTWPDLDESHMFYADILEASNGHLYDRQEDGVTEQWTKILKPIDWVNWTPDKVGK